MPLEVIDNIGDDLRAAMSEQVSDTPVVETNDDVAGDVRQAAESTETAEETAARVRDDKGRFAPKQEAAAQPVVKTEATPTTPAADTKSTTEQFQAPPRTWKPEQKAAFLELPPHLRQAILDNHAEMEKAQTEFQPKAQRLEQFEQMIGPRREKWALQGVNELQAMQQLFTASDYLDRDPVNAIKWLMQSTGVTPQHLFGEQGDDPQHEQQTYQRPANDPLVQRLQTLETYLQSQHDAQQQAAAAETQKQIDAFANDPKNLYFDNVKPRMGQLLQAGAATSLQDAYDQACWADPTVRPLMQKALAAETAKAAAAKVAEAKKAAGSITGSPGQGAAVRNSNPRNSVKDDLLEAMNEHMS